MTFIIIHLHFSLVILPPHLCPLFLLSSSAPLHFLTPLPPPLLSSPSTLLLLLQRGTNPASSGDYVLDPQELRAAFSDKTKIIIINNPNNPLGKVTASMQWRGGEGEEGRVRRGG